MLLLFLPVRTETNLSKAQQLYQKRAVNCVKPQKRHPLL